MREGRTRTTATLAALALTGAIALSVSASTTSAQAEPDIDSVRTKVDKLYHQAEQASERYNDAKVELTALKRDVGSLKADQSRQGKKLDVVRSEVRNAIIQRSQAGDLATTGDLISSDTDGFLDKVSTQSTIDDIQGALLSDYDTEVKAYSVRAGQTTSRLDEVADLESTLAKEKKTVDDKLADAKSLLGDLEAKQREAILSRGSDRAPDLGSVPASGRAKAAVAYALAQVGDAYVYGAAGPSAFDCSGLTMMAWAQAGVGLPHSSSAQSGSGARVSRSALQPGDLVFYYSPISHVGMYIGNGMIVHAANPGAGVKVSSVDEMPFAGAVRPG
ncbi:MAG: NlpC/P60 family protein [Nocardioidaceae bacterium]|nr:NlpC/P60 family protein [Nocardioidaceae bacterium]